MSNAVATLPAVSYADMEKMAVTVANSKLFGVKTKDEALALMALAHAEGVHPMTAVRDFHIIGGKPSLKADTMLARFISAGGKVEWHCLTDQKAEASFSHPSGGTVKIDWTLERAKTAGLAGKEVWKSYGRAMLRSRCISEGVRTVYPGVIAGTYSPEELLSLDTDVVPSAATMISSIGPSIVTSEQVDEWITMIREAKDMNSLKTVYQSAYKEALAAKDGGRVGTYALAYEGRKSELASQVEEAPRVVEGEVI